MSAPETADQFRERAAAVGMIEDACFVAATAEAFVGYSALTLTVESRLEAGSGARRSGRSIAGSVSRRPSRRLLFDGRQSTAYAAWRPRPATRQ
jgi:hypothetical protein